MRTQYSCYNFLVSLITSVALPIFGFIKVRMFIDLYGSDLNGLQLTIINVITFLNVFELSRWPRTTGIGCCRSITAPSRCSVLPAWRS